jgi:hypothetical protein
MSPKKTITVQIDPAGKTTIEAHGFQGQGCLAATAYLEEALGTPVGDRTLKPEIKQQTRSTPNHLRTRS